MKDVGGVGFAGSSLPVLGRERAAVDVDVGPERRSPRYHEICLAGRSKKKWSTWGEHELGSFWPIVSKPRGRAKLRSGGGQGRVAQGATSLP